MELYQLRSFVVVAREANLTRASEKLFTSVPAVSAQIKALEEEFGVQLFRRSARGMALTEAGERLLGEAERTLEAAQRVKAAASATRGEVQGVVRMGTIADPVSLRLGDALVLLAGRHPGVSLRLHQDISGRVLEKVRAGELDCGYVILDDAGEGLRAEALAPVELAVALPARFAGRAADMGLEEVTALPWVGTPPPCSMRRHAEDLFRQAGREFRFTVMADVEASMRSLVASGMGAGIMRMDQALEAQREGAAAIWPHWRARSSLQWIARDGEETPALQAVRGAVLEAWERAPA